MLWVCLRPTRHYNKTTKKKSFGIWIETEIIFDKKEKTLRFSIQIYWIEWNGSRVWLPSLSVCESTRWEMMRKYCDAAKRNKNKAANFHFSDSWMFFGHCFPVSFFFFFLLLKMRVVFSPHHFFTRLLFLILHFCSQRAIVVCWMSIDCSLKMCIVSE